VNLTQLMHVAHALSGVAWVQGPGGNVSQKDAQSLAVKASGTRLSELRRESLAFVPLSQARAALDGDTDAAANLFQHTPRPSLEIWLHALPGRYIVHTHPLGVLLLACTELKSLPNLADVPAALPGRDVALAMRAAGAVDAWLLRNHGLVVRAESAEQALRRTREIDAACRAVFDVSALDQPWLAPMQTQIVEGGVIALLDARKPLTPRYLFPDAAVLAAQTPVAALSSAIAAAKLLADPRPGLLVTPHGERWAVARNVRQLQDVVEVTSAHDWLLDHLGDRAIALPQAMTEAILDMPAERFRQLEATG
jgi:ribulose-5-phosphate 4-epimerase/fuculose-1-phosphate aldolase